MSYGRYGSVHLPHYVINEICRVYTLRIEGRQGYIVATVEVPDAYQWVECFK